MRKKALIISIICLGLTFAVIPATGADESGHVFVLKRVGDGFEIEKVPLAPGETKVIPCGQGTDIIDVILPVGPGQSGNLVRGDESNMLMVRNDGGNITLSFQKKDGSQKSMPAREFGDLQKYDIRLSVTAGDGPRTNFNIRQYTDVSEDDSGPVMDMFAGKIPMGPGDYSIYTSTAPAEISSRMTGKAGFEFSGRYLFTEVEGPDGRKGLFIIDIGASKTIITEEFLPPGIEITENYMMQYSQGEGRKMKYSPGGGTGPVETIKGSAALEHLKFGDMTFNNVSVDVITTLPEIHNRKIDGIIGMDIMKSARFLTLDYGRGGDDAAITISDQRRSQEDALELPYVPLRNMMYIRGSVNNTPVFFLLDSGAPQCVLPPLSAETSGVTPDSDSTITFKGGGGQEDQGRLATIKSLQIGDIEINDTPCMIGEIYVFQTIAEGQATGLMGNSVFSQFDLIEFDFAEEVVRFVR